MSFRYVKHAVQIEIIFLILDATNADMKSQCNQIITKTPFIFSNISILSNPIVSKGLL